jgi:hypothetical protein
MKYFILPFITVLFLAGCNRNKLPDLSAEEKKEIVSDARSILRERTRDEWFDIPEKQWPESFRKLDPVAVRRYSNGIGILTWKFVSKESGLFIPIPNYTPRDTQISGYEKISDDLYSYWISG